MGQLRIPAVYMRGGTSKGVFFRAADLPADPASRDALLLRVVGSPDPYGKQIDGMGAATSSTSKIVLLAPSKRPGCDVDYLFGQVAIDRPLIDWSGNCGNLTAAVGPFALSQGWVDAPRDGLAPVRIWQANVAKRIVAHVPVRGGEVVEEGEFVLDGVAFPAAEIRIEFLEPGGAGEEGGTAGAMLPTGHLVDRLDVPGVGSVEATLITAGNPTVFVEASALGLSGSELQAQVNGARELLARCEAVRAHAAVAMGLAASAGEASGKRLHTPKIAFVSAPQPYAASSGKAIAASDIDITIRMLSMGQLHHAVTGTGAVATSVACAMEETIPNRVLRRGSDPLATRIGHPSGVLRVGAAVARVGGEWVVEKAVMSRSARRLMEGWVRVPADALDRARGSPQPMG
ncbi:MAG TPA: 2-methylaconitate cis-trans isomerase PrpF [Usitatibacter sp.]|nr:2-methylaconitate cis-trans isomerase PrpF [Usitatibacter sp.]